MKSALSIVQKYYPNVTTLVDATKNIEIEVMKEDGRGAHQKSPTTCALAKAFCRSYDGAIISVSRAYLVKGNRAIRYFTPVSVSRELVSFDRHHEFAPGVYSLSAPTKGHELGSRKYAQSKKRRKKKYPREKNRIHRTTGIRGL